MNQAVTRTRLGRLPFATAHATHNGNRFYIAGVGQDSLHWLFKEAIQYPGEIRSFFFEENAFEYETWAVYLPNFQVIWTNYIRCPHAWSHHLYKTCEVCGQVG